MWKYIGRDRLALTGGIDINSERPSTLKEKFPRYEQLYINFIWIAIIVAFFYVLARDASTYGSNFFNDPFRTPEAGLKIIGLFLAVFLHFLKIRAFDKGLLERPLLFMFFRLSGTFFASFSIVYLSIGAWAHIIILMSVIVTSLFKGRKYGLTLLGGAFLLHMLLLTIQRFQTFSTPPFFTEQLITDITSAVFTCILFSLIAYFCGMVNSDLVETENKNLQLMNQLSEKYTLLEAAQEEIRFQYEKLKGTNQKLEETNNKLSANIAEFYTLQQISNAITSILDIKELLKYLNDIILGVMGVSDSTIALYDEKLQRLKVHVTNILNAREHAIMVDNINCSALLDALNCGRYIVDNKAVDSMYPFIRDRGVGSLICMPLNTKARKYGVLIVEHRHGNAFVEDNIRLLEIIAQQVGIAMENAELYQRMSELATRDGLTGLHNRQYFKQKLADELKMAEEQGYPLSLAIFDIDHFKKFNDTFGHLFGDKVLKTIAENIPASLRKNDVAARFGGEEFILLFPRTGLHEAYEKVEFLRKQISQMIIQDDLVVASVTVSFGVSCFNECAASEKALLSTADDALYSAKACGRNCVRFAPTLYESQK